MKLADFLAQENLTQAAFGKRCDPPTSQQRIGALIAGSIPKPNFMRAIFLATDGAVTPNDFFPLDAWRAELAAAEPSERAA